MRLIGLTGGIGSGKSSVSERLVRRGAELVDADAIVRELQEPGRPVFEAMVERWGQRIIADDGNLDRAAVAGIVFSDDAELSAVESIVHPALGKEMESRLAGFVDSEGVVILDIPLLAESRKKNGALNARGASAIIVVDCPIEIAVERLMTFRHFSEEDARARVAKQASREERLELADFVIDNSGELAALDEEIERCWTWLDSLPQTPWPPPKPSEAQPGSATR